MDRIINHLPLRILRSLGSFRLIELGREVRRAPGGRSTESLTQKRLSSADEPRPRLAVMLGRRALYERLQAPEREDQADPSEAIIEIQWPNSFSKNRSFGSVMFEAFTSFYSISAYRRL